MRALVALFILWNVMAFPGQSLPHAWVSGVLVAVVDGLAWLARRQRRESIVLWAMVTTAFDLILGLVALTEFSGTVQSKAPAVLPVVGIELIAYWGWIGHWIAMGYSAVAIVALWPFPLRQVTASSINHMIFWLAVNFLMIGSVAVFLQNANPPEPEVPGLTAREREVYGLMKAGHTQKDIAALLHIERSTVKSHVQHIHRKMGLDEPSDES